MVARKPGESAKEALIREVLEECGFSIRVFDFVGMADKLAFIQKEQTYFRKRCSFFSAAAQSSAAPGGSEPDHRLVWLTPDEAMSQLSHESQRWGLRAVFQRTE